MGSELGGVRASLVIRCRNEEAHIGRLLAGARRQDLPPHQIVVVDSGSTDATLAIAREFDVDVVTIAPEDFSFGRALNRGLEACDGEVAVLASAHVYPVYSSWLERLLAPFADERVALSYGAQRAPTDGRFSEQQILRRWFPARSEIPQTHPFCNNANAAVRVAAWAELPYDETLTGLEDLDWAKRALERGSVLAYVAEAPIVHVHDESFGQVLNRYRREAIAHKRIYPEQNMSGLAALGAAASSVASDLRAASSEGGLLGKAPDIVSFRAAQFLGTHRGFTQRGPVTETLKRRFFYPTRSEPSAEEAGILGAEEAPIDYDDGS